MVLALLIALSALLGAVVALGGLGRVQTETEDLLDGYTAALAEARQHYQRELAMHRALRARQRKERELRA